MANLTQEDLIKLAVDAREYLVNEEYNTVHLSYQLAMTSKVLIVDDGTSLMIDAPTYDVGQFRAKKILIHDNKGSYASANDTEGGFSGKHKGYIQRAIQYAIDKMLKEKGIDASEVEIRWN